MPYEQNKTEFFGWINSKGRVRKYQSKKGKNTSVIPLGKKVRWHTHPHTRANGYNPRPSVQNVKSIINDQRHGQRAHIIFTRNETYVLIPNKAKPFKYDPMSNSYINNLRKHRIAVTVLPSFNVHTKKVLRKNIRNSLL